MPIRRETVAAYAMDPANDLAWITGTRWIGVRTEGAVGLGDRFGRRANLCGYRFSYTLEVTGIEPGRWLVMETVVRSLPITVHYQFEDTERGTKATIRLFGYSKCYKRITGRLLGAVSLAICATIARVILAISLRRLEHRVLDRW